MISTLILVATVLILPPVDTADLGGYLERSAGADFSGELLVSCDTPDGSRDSVFEIAQTEGWVMAWVGDEGDSRVTLGQGTMVAVSGGQEVATAVESAQPGSGSPAYTVGNEATDMYLGRDVTEVSILRDGVERISLTVDAATGAVLRTKTLDENGNVYCDRRLLSFEPGALPADRISGGPDVVAAAPMEEAPPQLPEATRGFLLLDTYALDDGTLSYYSDGFFSFGVVVTERPFRFDENADVSAVESASGEYQRSFAAGGVSVAWSARGGNLALVGDLPPDLLDDVLVDLPQPVTSGFLGRIWDRLFG